jgi:hypothetical protein
VFFALRSALSASWELFGEQTTSRDRTIAGQALRTALWALVTPFCALAILRRSRGARASAFIWFALLAGCTWWLWPARPTGPFDIEEPLWHSTDATYLWLLVAAGLAVGLYAGWRSRHLFAKIAAAILIIATVGLGAWSNTRMVEQARGERPTRLAEGVTELAVLQSDPLWRALPTKAGTTDTSRPASLAPWGERLSTWKQRRIGTREDHTLFRDSVAIAENNGWRLVTTSCIKDYWTAELEKSLSIGPAHLRISVASWTFGVSVFAEVSHAPGAGQLGKCWPG